MASIFGCFSASQIGDVSRLEAHLRKNGDHFKKIEADEGVILLSWKDNDFFKIVDCKDLVFIFDGFDCSIHSSWDVVKDYRKEGDCVFSRLNGQANAVIVDPEEKIVKLVSDPFGLNFLYYTRTDKSIAFSSEMKLLLLYDPSLRQKINKYAVAEYVLLHYVLGNKTIFENIHLLGPSSVLKLNLNTFNYEIEKYVSFPSNYSKVIDYKRALRKAKDLLVKSVNKRIFDGAKLMLSGGLDSRLILASTDSSKRKSLSCINFGNLECNDVRFARLVAQKFGVHCNFHEILSEMITKNMERHIWITEGGSNHLVSYSLPILEAESPTTVLNGYLGDAILGGSYLDKVDPHDFSIQNVFRKLTIPEKIQKLAFTTEFYNEIHECFDKSVEMEAERYSDIRDDALKVEYAMMNNRGRRYINCGSLATKRYCPDLKPFFDKDFFNFYIRIPYNHRMEHKFYFDLIRQEYPELASIPSTTTHFVGRKIKKSIRERLTLKLKSVLKSIGKIFEGILPVFLFYKKKYKRIHVTLEDIWFRENKEYRSVILDLLLSRRTIKRGFFNKEGITKMLREHDARKHNYGKYFVTLADFELFSRLFIDGDGFKDF